MLARAGLEWDIISPQYYELGSSLIWPLTSATAAPCRTSRRRGSPRPAELRRALSRGRPSTRYDPRAFKDRKPTHWRDFWDVTNFPGPRSLPNTGSPWATLIFALIADGVPADKIFPLDLDRAFAKLDKIKAAGRRCGEDRRAEPAGDAPGRCGDELDVERHRLRHQARRRPLDWTWNNAVADFGSWVILKGARIPTRTRFHRLLHDESGQSRAFSREMGYSTSNKQAAALLTEEEKAELGAKPEVVEQIITPDADWLEATAPWRWNAGTAWISA